MGTLYLVRHGQASFGADDYDCLSALGERQSLRLGEHFRLRGLHFEAAITGTLQRQQQTLAGISEGLGARIATRLWPGLNEYDSDALIAAIHPQPLAKPANPEMVRQYFRLLRQGLRQWMAGTSEPAGMPSYADFVAGVAEALDHVRSQHTGDVLMVSSGGPISNAIGQVLGTSPEGVIDLNMRIFNSAVSELTFNPQRHALVSYNTLPHLELPQYADWITHA
jgi:broad specificity phosphatase PhoE